jgi:DNA topoisomerase-1
VARNAREYPRDLSPVLRHPVVLDSYLHGTLVDQFERRAEHTLANELNTLRPEEAAVLVLLRQALSKQSRPAR